MRASSSQQLALAFLAALAATSVWTHFRGESAALLPCPIQLVSGVRCPGCGITRACLAFVRADFATAWSFHPAAFVLIPLAVAFALRPRWARATWLRVPPAVRSGVLVAALCLLVARWILTGSLRDLLS